MAYTITQIMCGLFAFIALGQAIRNEATKFDKVVNYIVCLAFIGYILLIQEVLK